VVGDDDIRRLDALKELDKGLTKEARSAVQKRRAEEERQLLAKQLGAKMKIRMLQNARKSGGEQDDEDGDARERAEKYYQNYINSEDEEEYEEESEEREEWDEGGRPSAQKQHGKLLMKLINDQILTCILRILEYPHTPQNMINMCFNIFSHSVHLACSLELWRERHVLVKAMCNYTRLFTRECMLPRHCEAIRCLMSLCDPKKDGEVMGNNWASIVQCVSQIYHIISDQINNYSATKLNEGSLVGVGFVEELDRIAGIFNDTRIRECVKGISHTFNPSSTAVEFHSTVSMNSSLLVGPSPK
jgi:hypothetical protein